MKRLDSSPESSRNYSQIELTTKNNTVDLVYFIKTNDEKVLLPYDNSIPAYFKSSIFVGTWTKPELQKNICDQLNVINIEEYNILGNRYKNSQDHSKWAVTEQDVALCIGDLNRTDSQLKRSGGIMCLKSKLLSKLTKQFIYSSGDCPEEERKALFLNN